MQEYPLIPKKYTKNTKKLAIVYPNLYYGGVYSLGPLIIYNITPENWICDRLFLDTTNNLQYDLVGFTFQYELDLINIKNLIKKHKPKITFAGGPVCNMNPKILKNIVDFQILGEVEEILPKILKLYTPNKTQFLKKIKELPGIYTGEKITKTKSVNLDKNPYPLYQPLPRILNKDFVFGNTFILEIERGCPYHCKFCPIHTIYSRPKYRSLTNIKKIIDQGLKLNKRKKVTIYSASFTHPQKKQILQYLVQKQVKATIPSTKVEIFNNLELLKLVKKLGQKSLTTAPECNESLRIKLGKYPKDALYFKFAEKAKQLNFNSLKLYFMLGIPTQTIKDLEETVIFINKIKEIFPKIYVSFNPFTPKKGTELENMKFCDKKTLKNQIIYLKKNLKNIRMKIASPNTALKVYKIMSTT